jgi:hypothetical protein
MKTLDMEIAVMAYFNPRQNIIVPNVTGAGVNFGYVDYLHECDVLALSRSGYATEVEIKVSKSDLKKDLQKQHAHDNKFIKQLYFAVPRNLVETAIDLLPENIGILCVECRPFWKGKVAEHPSAEVIRGAIPRKDARKWNEAQRNQLMRLGVLRILGLKRKIRELENTK